MSRITEHIITLKHDIIFFNPTKLHFEENLYNRRICKVSFITIYNNRVMKKRNDLKNEKKYAKNSQVVLHILESW